MNETSQRHLSPEEYDELIALGAIEMRAGAPYLKEPDPVKVAARKRDEALKATEIVKA